ncbi:hypothetical protein T492DRAFT_1008123 [Pavlovales sp. CCMP2436]|nr:hypothetical protein T492DRAFT_1008123 [Pavlovales sp. CCMP2436]
MLALVCLAAALSAAQPRRLLETPALINNQKLARIRDKLVGNLEVRIGSMNGTSLVSATDCVRDLVTSISDVTGITVKDGAEELPSAKQLLNSLLFRRPLRTHLERMESGGLHKLLPKQKQLPALPNLPPVPESANALAKDASDLIKKTSGAEVEEETSSESDDDEEEADSDATADEVDESKTGDDENQVDSEESTSSPVSEEEEEDEADTQLPIMLNVTMLSQIRDRLVGSLEVAISHMSSTATISPSEVLSELLTKIEDITHIPASTFTGGEEGSTGYQRPVHVPDEMPGDSNVTVPYLSSRHSQQQRMPPALAFGAGVSTLAALVALTTARRRGSRAGIDSTLAEAILSEEELLARV